MDKESVLLDSEDRMDKALGALDRDFSRLRTGRASTGLVDNIKVDYYGTPTPISQLASVAIPDSRTITIQPWDRGAFASVEKAILKSDLGLTPVNDGKIIRISIPPLTEDRRKELGKLARKSGEEAKVAVRNVRRDANDQLKKLEKDKAISEDELKKATDDVQKLTDMLTWARELRCPVLLHVQTAKGRGCRFAEQDPGRFHGVEPFDPLTGRSKRPSRPSFSSVFGSELTALAQEDPSVCAITAAMESGTGLTPFAKAHPERFFDVGIAEGHAVAMAAGMAKQGMRPVFAVYSSFLQRGYDMLIHDVSLDGLHVVFGIDRAGLVGADGETHHGCFDALYLPQVPGMTVYCPANFAELRRMLRRALYETDGPAAVRYPRGGEGAYYTGCGSDALADCLREGTDCTVLSYGVLVNHALEAARRLEAENTWAAEQRNTASDRHGAASARKRI